MLPLSGSATGPEIGVSAHNPLSLLAVAPTILGVTENDTDEVTVTINNPVSLICEALAFPSPTVTWMKDGTPLEASRNVQQLPGDALW